MELNIKAMAVCTMRWRWWVMIICFAFQIKPMPTQNFVVYLFIYFFIFVFIYSNGIVTKVIIVCVDIMEKVVGKFESRWKECVCIVSLLFSCFSKYVIDDVLIGRFMNQRYEDLNAERLILRSSSSMFLTSKSFWNFLDLIENMEFVTFFEIIKDALVQKQRIGQNIVKRSSECPKYGSEFKKLFKSLFEYTRRLFTPTFL